MSELCARGGRIAGHTVLKGEKPQRTSRRMGGAIWENRGRTGEKISQPAHSTKRGEKEEKEEEKNRRKISKKVNKTTIGQSQHNRYQSRC